MTPTITFLLALCFAISVIGLLALVWSIATNQFGHGPTAARTIFAEGEVGLPDEPAAPPDIAREKAAGADAEELSARRLADESTRVPVLTFLGSAVVWLVVGSFYGLLSSLKMHWPELLTDSAVLTFGRIRPMHLNAVAYGWASMAGLGVAIWLLPRLFKTPLVGARFATASAVLWNVGMISGLVALGAGLSDGMEWLEIPWQIDIIFVVAGALAAVPLLLTVRNRRVDHLYVTSWYLMAALIWFPILFLVANMPHLFPGASGATVNWWFAHNVLGLWVTPIGVGTAYYLIPKIIGKPIYSYQLSLLGFWALALFYSQVGMHHLEGGPVPTWLVTLSIVQSVMMVIPVVTVGINHHATMIGHFHRLKDSPTLRFVWLGSLMYTLSSLEGSVEALRSVNRITHFTHFTVGHAHLGMYGFLTFILFGAIYFIMPRLVNWEWPSRRLIAVHFWLVMVGITIYVISLTIGGWLEGEELNNASIPFIHIVQMTVPYLEARTIGGSLMTLGHLVFAGHFFTMLLRTGRARSGAAMFRTSVSEEVPEA